MVSCLYGYWLWLTSAQALGAGELLRLPFFFIVAVFYAYVTEETKQERWRRQQAERESTRLQFLLDVTETFSQRAVSAQLVGQLGSLVEAAFPRLRCNVQAVSAEHDAGLGTVFLVQTHGRAFGAFRVATPEDEALTPDEEQFCKVVAAIAANALYSAEQVGAVQEGTRLKQEFLSTLSHELRSPLHVILGNADIIAEETKSVATPFVLESIDRLRVNAFRLLDIVEELLCFTELRAGSASVYDERVDLCELFDELSASTKERLAARPIHFEWHVDASVPVLFTDRRKLRLIVNGLLGNAVKFTENGFVRLTAQRVSGDAVEIAVQDTGIGIDPKDLPQIFQEFRQVDGSLRRRFDGLGLGLALAQELVQVIGGRLDVESQPQRGSTFRMHLPLRGDREGPRQPGHSVPLAVESRTGLLSAA